MEAIRTRGLTKFYGKARGIQGLDLSVEEGEVFGFIGPNGAGKSTTIRTLLGFLRPSSGEARLLGMDTRREAKEIARHVGYVPSEVQYYDTMRVGELLRYSARFYGLRPDGRAAELVKLFEVDESRRIVDLSTGNRKKVAIVQSLLHRPSLIVLDEPTMGLDPLMQERFVTLIRRVNAEGTTVFLSSHVLSEVEGICGRVAVVRDGRILEVEEISRLRSRHFLKVEAELANGGSDWKLELEGVISSETDGPTIRLRYEGDVDRLVSELHKRRLRHLTVTEPSLEEVFVHYYKQ
jgi:ABC-2 type transport system ATP-binding protein